MTAFLASISRRRRRIGGALVALAVCAATALLWPRARPSSGPELDPSTDAVQPGFRLLSLAQSGKNATYQLNWTTDGGPLARAWRAVARPSSQPFAEATDAPTTGIALAIRPAWTGPWRSNGDTDPFSATARTDSGAEAGVYVTYMGERSPDPRLLVVVAPGYPAGARWIHVDVRDSLGHHARWRVANLPAASHLAQQATPTGRATVAGFRLAGRARLLPRTGRRGLPIPPGLVMATVQAERPTGMKGDWAIAWTALDAQREWDAPGAAVDPGLMREYAVGARPTWRWHQFIYVSCDRSNRWLRIRGELRQYAWKLHLVTLPATTAAMPGGGYAFVPAGAGPNGSTVTLPGGVMVALRPPSTPVSPPCPMPPSGGFVSATVDIDHAIPTTVRGGAPGGSGPTGAGYLLRPERAMAPFTLVSNGGAIYSDTPGYWRRTWELKLAANGTAGTPQALVLGIGERTVARRIPFAIDVPIERPTWKELGW